MAKNEFLEYLEKQQAGAKNPGSLQSQDNDFLKFMETGQMPGATPAGARAPSFDPYINPDYHVTPYNPKGDYSQAPQYTPPAAPSANPQSPYGELSKIQLDQAASPASENLMDKLINLGRAVSGSFAGGVENLASTTVGGLERQATSNIMDPTKGVVGNLKQEFGNVTDFESGARAVGKTMSMFINLLHPELAKTGGQDGISGLAREGGSDFEKVMDPIQQETAKFTNIESQGTIGRIIAGAAGSTPTSLVTKIPIIGWYLMANQSFRNAIDTSRAEAAISGKPMDENAVYINALGSAAIEVGTEMMFGAFKPFAKGLQGAAKGLAGSTIKTSLANATKGFMEMFGKKAAEKVMLPTIGNYLKFVAKQAAEEGTEELVGGIASGILAKMTVNPDGELFDWQSIFEQTASGALSGGFMAGVGQLNALRRTRAYIEELSGVEINKMTDEQKTEILTRVQEDMQTPEAQSEVSAKISTLLEKAVDEIPVEQQAEITSQLNQMADSEAAPAVPGVTPQTQQINPAMPAQPAAPVAAPVVQTSQVPTIKGEPTSKNTSYVRFQNATGKKDIMELSSKPAGNKIAVQYQTRRDRIPYIAEVDADQYLAANDEVKKAMLIEALDTGTDRDFSARLSRMRQAGVERDTINGLFAVANKTAEQMVSAAQEKKAGSATAQETAGNAASASVAASETESNKSTTQTPAKASTAVTAAQNTSSATQQTEDQADEQTIRDTAKVKAKDLTKEQTSKIYQLRDKLMAITKKHADPKVYADMEMINQSAERNKLGGFIQLTSENNLTKQQKDAAKSLEQGFGKKVVYFHTVGSVSANAMIAQRTSDYIFVNSRAESGRKVKFDHIMWSVGHELTHVMETSKNYKVFAEVALQYLGQDAIGQFKQDFADKPEYLAELGEDGILRELIADQAGDLFKNPQFWRDLSEATPDKTRAKVFDEIGKRLTRMSKISKAFASRVKPIQQALVAAYTKEPVQTPMELAEQQVVQRISGEGVTASKAITELTIALANNPGSMRMTRMLTMPLGIEVFNRNMSIDEVYSMPEGRLYVDEQNTVADVVDHTITAHLISKMLGEDVPYEQGVATAKRLMSEYGLSMTGVPLKSRQDRDAVYRETWNNFMQTRVNWQNLPPAEDAVYYPGSGNLVKASEAMVAPGVAQLMEDADHDPAKGVVQYSMPPHVKRAKEALHTMVALSYREQATGEITDADMQAIEAKVNQLWESCESVMAVIDQMTDLNPIVFERIMRQTPYTPSKTEPSPLRKNTGGYVFTFDLDTDCTRALEFRANVDELTKRLGRYPTQPELINLILTYRATASAMIPCLYCYVEGKRATQMGAYNTFVTTKNKIQGLMRQNNYSSVAAAWDDLKFFMYGYDSVFTKTGKLAAGENGALVDKFERWYNEAQKGHPIYSETELMAKYWDSRRRIFDQMDQKYTKKTDFVPNTAKKTIERLTKEMAKQLGISEKEPVRRALAESAATEFAAQAKGRELKFTEGMATTNEYTALQNIVTDWVYNMVSGLPHEHLMPDNGGQIDLYALRDMDDAMKYMASSSSAKNRLPYERYVDQLAYVSLADKQQMNAHGGLRIHSSNDFRIDHALDYILLIQQMEADKRGGTGWFSHMYTKSVDCARFLAKTGIKINCSVAFNTDPETGEITINENEGMKMRDVIQLRAISDDIGGMAMVVDNAQLLYALRAEWIDQIIPFHNSGMQTVIFEQALGWLNYQGNDRDKQLDKPYLINQLESEGRASREELEKMTEARLMDLFFEGRRRPAYYGGRGTDAIHFRTDKGAEKWPGTILPYDQTSAYGDVLPGHQNNAQRYLEICREYGYKPRFYDISLQIEDGSTIRLTEDKNFDKLIKEHSGRVAQRDVTADFDVDQFREMLERFEQAGGYASSQTPNIMGSLDMVIEQNYEKDEQGNLRLRADRNPMTLRGDGRTGLMARDEDTGFLSPSVDQLRRNNLEKTTANLEKPWVLDHARHIPISTQNNREERMNLAMDILAHWKFDMATDSDHIYASRAQQIKGISLALDLADAQLDITRNLQDKGLYSMRRGVRRDNFQQGKEVSGIHTFFHAFEGFRRNWNHLDFVGKQIETHADLGGIMMIARDPRFETGHIIYVKNEQVVGHEAWTSHQPSAAAALPVDLRHMTGQFSQQEISDLFVKEIDRIKARALKYGADTLYFSHNHPSGDPEPSQADISVTASLGRTLGKLFGGSISTDHNSYNFKNYENGNVVGGTYFLGTDEYGYTANDPLQLSKLKSPKTHEFIPLMQMINQMPQAFGMNYTNDDYTLIYLNAGGKLTGLQQIPGAMANDLDQLQGYMDNARAKFGGSQVLALTGNPSQWRQIEALVSNKTIFDAILFNKDGSIAASTKTNKAFTGAEVVPKKTAALMLNENLDQFGGEVTEGTPAFYSPFGAYLFSLVEKGGMKMPPSQWMKKIEGSGVKLSYEYEFLGLRQWLADQQEAGDKSLTAQQIYERYLEDNDMLDEANDVEEDYEGFEPDVPKFRWESYSPGREFGHRDEFDFKYDNYRMKSLTMSRNRVKENYQNEDMQMHNSMSNVMMFTRVEDIYPDSDTRYPNGITYGIEAQSDWHSEGQQKGYESAKDRQEFETRRAEARNTEKRLRGDLNQLNNQIYNEYGKTAEALLDAAEKSYWILRAAANSKVQELQDRIFDTFYAVGEVRRHLRDYKKDSTEPMYLADAYAQALLANERYNEVQEYYAEKGLPKDSPAQAALDAALSVVKAFDVDDALQFKALADKYESLHKEHDKAWRASHIRYEPKAPDVPWKNDYMLLGFKLWLRDAIRDGKDAVAWSGWTHAARWQVPNNYAEVTIRDRYQNQSDEQIHVVDYSGRANHSPYRHNATFTGTEQEVMRKFGQEMGAKILASKPGDLLFGQSAEDDDGYPIKNAFIPRIYDEQLVRMVNKYVKQWGAQAEYTKIEGMPGRHWVVEVNPQMRAALESRPQPAYSLRRTQTQAPKRNVLWEASARFKQLFGKSVLKTAEGKPILFYHGTNASQGFNDFKLGRKSNRYGAGVYFSDDGAFAGKVAEQKPNDQVKAPRVVMAFLRMENPVWEPKEWWQTLDRKTIENTPTWRNEQMMRKILHKPALGDPRTPQADTDIANEMWPLYQPWLGGVIADLGYDGVIERQVNNSMHVMVSSTDQIIPRFGEKDDSTLFSMRRQPGLYGSRQSNLVSDNNDPLLDKYGYVEDLGGLDWLKAAQLTERRAVRDERNAEDLRDLGYIRSSRFAKDTGDLGRHGEKLWIDPQWILDYTQGGVMAEELKIAEDPTGQHARRMDRLVSSMRQFGFVQGENDDEIHIYVDSKGQGYIAEGNHRIRAAAEVGVSRVPIRITYFAGGQMHEGVWKPDDMVRLAEGQVRYSLRRRHKFAENINPSNFAKAVVDEVSRTMLWYDVKVNQETLNEATAEIQTNRDQAKMRALDVKQIDPVATVLRMVFMMEAQQRGDHHQAANWAGVVMETGKIAGQAAQAHAIFKRLSPEGVRIHARQTFRSHTPKGLLQAIEERGADLGKRFAELDIEAARKLVGQLGTLLDLDRDPADILDEAKRRERAAKLLENRIEQYMKTTDEFDADAVRTFIETLHSVAVSTLPLGEVPTTIDPVKFMRRIISGQKKYAEVWASAMAIIRNMHVTDTRFMAELQAYFGEFAPEPFLKPVRLPDSVLQVDLQSIRDAVIAHYQMDYKTFEALVTRLQDLGLDVVDAIQTARTVQQQMDLLTREEKIRATRKILPKSKRSSARDKINKIINLANEDGVLAEDFEAYIASIMDLPSVDPALGKELTDIARAVAAIRDVALAEGRRLTKAENRQIDVLTAMIAARISARIPSTIGQKISTFQVLMMLSMFKPGVRNIVGNTVFLFTDTVKDVTSVGFDRVLGKITGQNTIPLPDVKAYVQGALRGGKEGWEDLILGVDTANLDTGHSLPKGEVFKNPVGRLAMAALRLKLSVPDRVFQAAAFESHLAGLMKMHPELKEPTADMIEAAQLFAAYKTFTDDNPLSNALVSTRRLLNFNRAWGLGDFLLKFPRVPGALLMRTIEYTPISLVKAAWLGLIKPVYESKIKTGGTYAQALAKNQQKVALALANGTWGSLVTVGLGILLRLLGLITGRPDPDKDKKAMQDVLGIGRGYLINRDGVLRWFTNGLITPEAIEAAKPQPGDHFSTYSWMAPLSVGLSIGANLTDETKSLQQMDTGAQKLLDMALVTGMSGLETMSELSVLSGISNLITDSGYKTGIDAADRQTPYIGERLLNVMVGVPATFIPGEFKAVRELLDNTQRSTYSDELVEYSYNLMLNKIPGQAGVLPPRFDAFGNLKELYQNNGNNLFNVLLNPAFTSQLEYNRSALMVLNMMVEKDANPELDGVRVVPKTSFRSISTTVNGKKMQIQLTAEEQSAMLRRVGRITDKEFQLIPGNLSNADKAKLMQDIMNAAAEIAEEEILRERLRLGQ